MTDRRTLALDVGGTKFSLGAFIGSKLELVQTIPTNREGGPAWMFSEIEKVWRGWTDLGFSADRCGIGFGGPVDFPTQTVTLSTHVAGWAQYPLLDNLRSLTGAPGVIDNDANVGALGEAYYGAAQGFPYLLYITVSTGIGGGIILDGKVYRGADSYAGELGHLMIDPAGPACLCGSNGCFERMCCGLWLERDYGKPAKELFRSPEFVRRYVVLMARGLKAAIMVLNPSRVVIGGGISKAGDRLFGPLRTELDRQITPWSRARKDVIPAQLGDQSILYGALALAENYL